MPLIQSASRDAISANIRELIASGHPRNVAIAAALHTADRYGKHRAAGGSSGGTAPTAPSAPSYSVPNAASQGILPSGLMNVPRVGDYTMDLNTGALSPQTQSMLASYAMRGLPPPGGYPVAAPPPAPVDPTVAAGPNSIASITSQGGETGGSAGKRGGRIPHLANGGVPSSAEMAPWFMRSEAHSMDHPSGLVHNFGPGRTDTVPMSVASGSHVVPADVLSGLGEGNSLAGAHAMSVAMKTGPGGISLPSGPHKPMALPRMPSMTHMARGGDPQFEGHPIKIAKGNVPEHQGGVRCIVAGGEWVCKPDEVQRISYKGKHGHAALDQWIVDRRAKDVKTIRNLPGPVKS
jgi:hypothetical protein